MQIQIDGQGSMEVTTALRDLTIKKMERALSHVDRVKSVHVIFKINNDIEQTASVNVSVPGSVINAHAKSEDMYKTIDMLITNLEVQLAKYKDKITKHRS